MLACWLTFGLLSVASTASASFQRPFKSNTYDDGLFTPLESLSSLSESGFTDMSHPFFPNYGVRIKKTHFCDGSVNSYTGYIDIEARHLFFYFFESRNDSRKDDVIFWTNGGPGCSSSLGLLTEPGPCRVLDANGPKYFEQSWNTNANVFFIDQPVGVGFSYAEYGEQVVNSEEAAKDAAAFVAIFFENFSEFKGRRFHMAGESYGGRYIPLFASAVYDQNAKLTQAGLTPINLTSAIIGNGITEPFSMALSYYDMQCTNASGPPVQDIATCVQMKQILPRCHKWVKESCIDTFDAVNCKAAAQFCESELSDPFYSTGRNPYDISIACDGPIEETLCYPVTKHIASYLSRPEIHRLLGVDPIVRSKAKSNYTFSSCAQSVGSAFAVALDELHPSHEYIAALLERGVEVLIYVGTYDWICNWVGNERWTLDLEWSGKSEFAGSDLRVWEVEPGVRAGRTRGKRATKGEGKRGLVYATVEGAGHMVPYDKPKEALALINRWLAGEEL